MQIFTGMDLIGQIDAIIVKHVQNRFPATRQFGKALLDQPFGALRPRINQMPHQRARKSRTGFQTEPAAGNRRLFHLVNRPCLPRLGIAVHRLRSKGVKQLVIGRMDRNQLPLQMG